MKRIVSIDIVRGLVMIIMAIDHIREFFHAQAQNGDPLDMQTTTPVLFFTRWVTHLCAPTFVFLAGTSVFLTLQRRKDVAAMQRFLLSRGAWLLLLEFTVITFGVWFDIRFEVFMFQVIATIGVGFILLAAMLRIAPKVLGIIGVAIVVFHALVPPAISGTALQPAVSLLFSTAFYQPAAHVTFLMLYPPIPWFGVMLAGYGAGVIFLRDMATQRRLLVRLGLGCLVLFVALRFWNVYGNGSPWSAQRSGLFTFLSFINVTKYPPSLLYCLLMLGIAFLLLRITTGTTSKVARVLQVYGKVPFFYYLIHWYVIHIGMFLLLYLQGFHTGDFRFGLKSGRPAAPNGLPLWGVYLVWLSVILLMYPLCRWYGRYKDKHRDNRWLSYL